MRKYIPGNLAIILSGAILIFISCAPESCLEETEAFVKATFYEFPTTKLRTPDSLTIYGLNMENNKLYNKALKVQTALFPLNASSQESTFIIIINGVRDTIQFKYSSYPRLVSKECGYTFFHRLDTEPKFTDHIIKYIYTGNNSITTVNEENIRISY
jgi:hypothetical protein